MMKDTIRCCISCILPCGALDVVRIVHVSGRVEEISGHVSAADIMQAYPKHVLKKPPTPAPELDSGDKSVSKAAVILPPSAELQRGKIYFLIPVITSPAPEKTRSTVAGARRRKKKRSPETGESVGGSCDKTRLLLNERYLSEIMSEKASSGPRDRRRGRVGVWRPHLESIAEVSLDC